MKKAYYKMLVRFHSLVFSFCLVCNANDINFTQDDNGVLLAPSITEQQTQISESNPRSIKAMQNPISGSLIREANIKRNGYYIMACFNMIPVTRSINNESTTLYSQGFGIRSGVISYLDGHIGMRGYFGLDFTSDTLAFNRQDTFNGNLVMMSLGMDIMIDFFMGKKYKHAIGFFVGIGAAALIYFDSKTPIVLGNGSTSNFAWGGNVTVQGGVSITFWHKNKIEFGLRFLPSQSLALDEDGAVADFNYYLGYSYKF